MRALRAAALGACLSVCLPACGVATLEGDAGPRADAGVDAGPADAGLSPAGFVFAPEALDEPGRFYDFPFPSDLRTDARGHPDLSGFPRARGLIADAIAIVEAERPGFSPITGAYFRFSGPLDAERLPTDPAAPRDDPECPVLLLDIDPDSPEQGRRLPGYVRFQAQATRFWASNTLVVRPVPGIGYHPGRRYAVVVREGLRGADGQPAPAAPAFEALKEGGGGEVGAHYAALFETLEGLGIPRAEVRAATAFTISDPAIEMDQARVFVHAQPLPEVTGWRVLASLPNVTRYEATFETYDLMDGAPPFMEFGSGTIRFAPDGTPATVARRPVRVGLSVPTTPAAPEGHPVVLYGHGTGGDHQTHFRHEGDELASIGAAALGFEAALHGARNPGGFDVGTLVVANPIAARETVRQTVVDMMLLYRMLAAGAFDLPASVTGGEPLRFAPEPVLYMGHSQGAQEAGLLLGVEPTVQSAFLSAGGGGGVITILEREIASGQPLSCLVAGVLSEPCEVLTEDHPALSLIIQPLLDPADPLSFAHRFVRERPEDWAPLSVAMTEGTEDTSTPPRTIEALAVAIGLPIVAPLVQATDPFELVGRPTVTPPAMGNLMTPSGAPVTGGLMQWSGVGHFAIYALDDARDRYVEFFRSAIADGLPTIAQRR
ncbi:MAG: hypothetical protein EVA89_07080 [Sandaracinaceae bacterium]|nr:MAG: hypothetical protein EVA89_07080 [Sandaracinaceae bacterium]